VVQAVVILASCALLGACDKPSNPAPPPTRASGSAVIAAFDAAAVPIADAGVDAVPVDAAPIACTAAAIGASRKEADAHVKAGTYDAAIAILQADTCWLEDEHPEPLNAQIAWRVSDLAFAYFKAGKFGECYGTAAGQIPPYRGNIGQFFEDSHAVMKALAYNAKLCEKAAAKERGPFEASITCTLAQDAFGVPASALDGTDKAACLVLEPGKKDEDDMNACGDVVLVRQSKKGRLSKTTLTVGEGNLGDGSTCCNVEGVSFSRRGPKLAILVETLGRDCNGGTAASEEQHAYMLEGTTLDVFHSIGAIAH
jgi:hypothetical protein